MRPVDKSCIEVSTHRVEESTHANNEKLEIKVSTHWIEELKVSTHDLEVSTHKDSVQRIDSGVESVCT